MHLPHITKSLEGIPSPATASRRTTAPPLPSARAAHLRERTHAARNPSRAAFLPWAAIDGMGRGYGATSSSITFGVRRSSGRWWGRPRGGAGLTDGDCGAPSVGYCGQGGWSQHGSRPAGYRWQSGSDFLGRGESERAATPSVSMRSIEQLSFKSPSLLLEQSSTSTGRGPSRVLLSPADPSSTRSTCNIYIYIYIPSRNMLTISVVVLLPSLGSLVFFGSPPCRRAPESRVSPLMRLRGGRGAPPAGPGPRDEILPRLREARCPILRCIL